MISVVSFNLINNSVVESHYLLDIGLLFLGWFLGFAPLAYTHDLSAKEKCDETISDLRDLLVSQDPYKVDNAFLNQQPKAVWRLINKLAVQKSGLFVPLPALDVFVKECLGEFKNPKNRHANVVLIILGKSCVDTSESEYCEVTLLDQIQIVLRASCLKRIMIWLQSKTLG